FLARTALVAFPDDDCWYPEGSLDHILGLFQTDEALDFWFCGYASAPQSATDARPSEMKSPSVFQVAASASSNTMFLRGRIAEAIGDFDEELGVGTENNGGEDTDYALRAFQRSRKSRFVNRALIGHRDNSPQFRSRYFRGSLIAIARHTAMRPASIVLLLRKLAVGGFLVASGRLSLPEFRAALRTAFSSRTERMLAPAPRPPKGRAA
ncbi:MAG: glycosyltransferase family 2 protein, partial [Parvibaculaceae bacterium]